MGAAGEGVRMKYRIEIDGKPHEVEVEEKGSAYVVTVDGTPYEVRIEEIREKKIVEPENPQVTHATPLVTGRPQVTSITTSIPGLVTAPMPGTILKIRVSVGRKVAVGDVLLTLEAMKMENEISSPVSGTVKEVHVKEGDSANTGDKLISISA